MTNASVTRLIFLHTNRVADSILTLSFDRYLNPAPEKTFIFYGPKPEDIPDDLYTIYETHGIDTSTFTIVSDREYLNDHNVQVGDIYNFGGWIAQQLIKFTMLDLCKSDYVLIQDCDTFSIKEYTYFQDNTPNYYIIENETHSAEYYIYLEKFGDIKRQNSDSFVTEFCPVVKKDWNLLKDNIEKKYSMDWSSAMKHQFKQDQPSGGQIWFSEYEMIGNWVMHLHPDIKTTLQKRWLMSSTNIDTLNVDSYNSVCCVADVLQYKDVSTLVKNIQGKINE